MAARWRCSFPSFSPLHWQHFNRSGDGHDRTQVGSSGSSCRSGIVLVRVVVSRTVRRKLNEAMQALDEAAASVEATSPLGQLRGLILRYDSSTDPVWLVGKESELARSVGRTSASVRMVAATCG